MPKLTLIDGSGFIFRAFHALPPLRRPDGVPVGAVYGFCSMLFKTLIENKTNTLTDCLVVVFDAGRQTFRQEIYPDYKAHRPEAPEDLIPQFQLIREACTAFNIPTIEAVGFEADDLIATYANHARKVGYEVNIISSDKDLMQLVSPGISMLDPLKNRSIGEAEVLEKFGVPPSKVVEVQALAGDSSDNVPGVPGIGIKTAAELINTYGDLENLLARAHEIKQPKRREALLDHAEKARISHQLVSLRHDAPLPLPLEDLKIRPLEQLAVNTFLRTQGFNSLIARIDRQNAASNASPASHAPQELPGFSINQPPQIETTYETVTTLESLNSWIKRAMESPVIAIDTETTSLNAVKANLVGLSLALGKGQACYIPLAHQTSEPQLNRDVVLAALEPLLTNPCVLKVGHNLKYDLVVLGTYGVTLSPLTDTMLLSYVLDAGKNGHGMDELAELHLGYKTIKFTDVVGTGKAMKTFDHVPLAQATAYAAEDADITLQLYHIFHPRLSVEKMTCIFERLERPLVPIIAAMERQGIRIDRLLLDRLGSEFSTQMTQLEAEIHQLAGRVFNVGSPKQLGEILFDDLGLSLTQNTDSPQKTKPPKKTKTGAYVTDVDVLESLAAQGHDLPARVLEWRGLAKLKSTYVDALIAAACPKTGRAHTSYSLAGTSTGRLSSSDPNLQNIPIKTENGRKIRRAFVTDPGYRLVSLDYSQIELRLLAHMAEVPTLTEAFRKGIDIHAATAATMFGGSPDQIDGALRRKAKTINFGIIYGISAFGLSQQLGISQGEAASYIKSYFETYPGIRQYMERCKEFARHHGYVQTLWGRKCYTLGIQDNNPIARQFAERQAINAPLQGTNADIIKRAMIHIPPLLQRLASNTHMLLQVHDELVFEVPERELETTIPALKRLMENILTLKVPLVVGVGIGNNWDEAH
jgi:DNA polymerase-1